MKSFGDEMNRNLRVLFVEDDKDYPFLIIRLLEKEGYEIQSKVVETAFDMERALSEANWDIIISDYSMPMFSGEEALELYIKKGLDIPFILISGTVSEEIAVRMLKMGAQNYISKNKLNVIIPAINKELKEYENRKEQEKIHQAWLDSERRFRIAFENTPVGICLITLPGIITKVNHAFCQIVGYELSEVEGKNFRDFTYGADIRENERQIARLIEGNENFITFEKRYVRKDSSLVWVLVSASIVKDENGVPEFFISQIQDVSQRKQAEIDIQIAKTKAEESDRLKSALLANMSHELRTPLNGILGFVELIKQSKDISQIFDMAKMIDISGRRLMQTLDSIMLFAQLESGKIDVNNVSNPTNLSEVTSQIVNGITKAAKEKLLDIVDVISPKVMVYADPILLKQAVANVLDNAVKFTDTGTITISLKPQLYDQKRFAKLDIIDTGIGISEGQIDAIFQDFRQASEGYGRKYEGTGIGLSITKRVVNLLGGFIQVSSEFKKGTTFTIMLPLLEEPEIKDTEISGSYIDSTKQKGLLDSQLEGILIVEDNIINSKLLSQLMKPYAVVVDCASTGEIAVNMAKNRKYSAILMDINLGPGIDGLEATKQIRTFPEYQSVPIIAVTGYTMLGDKEKLLAGGCNGYVAKPFEKKDILQALENAFISIQK